MAISKRAITTVAEMKQFIEDSGFFDTVTLDMTGGTNYEKIVCSDADSNTVFMIENLGGSAAKWYGYADATNSVYEQVGGVYCTAYSTAKGLLFINGYSSSDQRGAACVVSKTNNGAYCVLLPKDNKCTWGGTITKAVDQQAIAWGDSAPYTNLVNPGIVTPSNNSGYVVTETANQTIFLPIATHSAYGTPSFFADTFFMPISQYRIECVFEIDGVYYVTDGFVALRDE